YVVTRQDTQSAGVNRKRLVQTELGRKICDRAWTQNSRMGGSPGSVCLQVFLLAPVGIVDAAVQNQLAGPSFQLLQRNLVQQCNRIVIELPPAHRIQIAEQSAGFLVPAPPQIARQRP